MNTNLRSSARIPVTYRVHLLGDSMIGQGTLLNLSGPGCALETTLPMQPGDYLELHVMAPDQARPLTVGLAKVRWATEQQAGIEFIRIQCDHQSRLQRLLEQMIEDHQMMCRLIGPIATGREAQEVEISARTNPSRNSPSV